MYVGVGGKGVLSCEWEGGVSNIHALESWIITCTGLLDQLGSIDMTD